MHDPLITCRSPSAPVASRVPAWAWATAAVVAGVAGLLLAAQSLPTPGTVDGVPRLPRSPVFQPPHQSGVGDGTLLSSLPP